MAKNTNNSRRSYTRRETGSTHIFADTGLQPWRWVGVHPSCRPEGLRDIRIADGQLDDSLHIQWFGMVRVINGNFVNKGGIDYYGNARGLNGWLARTLNNHADKIREIVIKKAFYGVDDECKGGRTPSLKLKKQEVHVHLVLAKKDVRQIKPDQPNVQCNGSYFVIEELEGWDIDPETGMLSKYSNKNAKAVREWLDKGYARFAEVETERKQQIEAKEKAIDKELAEDNPFDQD